MRENRGLAAAIAVTSLVFLVTLPFTIPSTIWLVIFVYAIVTFFTLAISVAVSLLGRSMTPKRRKRWS